MTDFLTNVTARSFGTEARIRPRLASLFEPSTGLNSSYSKSLAPHPEGPEAISETEALPDVADKTVKNPEALHAAKAGHAVVKTAPQSGNESPGNLSPKIGSVNRARTDGVVVPTAQEPRINEDSKLSHLVTARDQDPIVPEHSSPRAGEANGRDWTRVATTSSPTVPGIPRNEVANETATLSRHNVAEARSPLLHSSKAVAELAAQMRDAAAAMGTIDGALGRQDASRSTRTSAAETDSSVQVTIGRIEVRAVTENNRVRRAPTASPVMSLEEYMQRRAQRGVQ